MLSFEFILLISALALAALSVYLFTTSVFTNDADSEALAWASGDEPQKSKSPIINFSRTLVHNFTLQHALRIQSPRYRAQVQKRILTAGLSQELNVDEYIGLQILWGIMAPIFLAILNFALALGLPSFAIIAMVPLGIFFPAFYCSGQTKQRYTSVISDLPFFTDLLALSTEAGLDFINAIQRIVDKAENSVLADEFYIVLKDIKLGSSRAEALKGLAQRLNIPEITSFVAVIIDADQTGAPIARVLKDQSEQMRLERLVRAERAGARASQLMLLPMIVFIVPAVMIAVFAPLALSFFYGGGS